MRTCTCLLTALCLVAVAPAASAAAYDEGETAVAEALLATYIHGVTDDVADGVQRELPVDMRPVLRKLLLDPTFPRRDNVVAFLAHLPETGALDDLLAVLRDPPAGWEGPEEDRALLMVPQTIGHLARFGDGRALEMLMRWTAADDSRDLLWSAARRHPDPQRTVADLLSMALRGLAFTGDPSARERLQAVMAEELQFAEDAGGLARDAFQSLELFDELWQVAPGGSPPVPPAAATPLPADTLQRPDPPVAQDPALPLTFDTQADVDDNGLDYSNHVDLGNPMTDARLDDVFEEANRRAGRSDYSGDVACCVTISRLGTGGSWGSPGDGLDRIDNGTELNAAINDGSARIKVVRSIGYCGGPGSGIVGCGNTPGDGIVVVRMGSLVSEAILWIHEYGHNAGLGHASDFRRLMYGAITGSNNGMSQNECNFYHDPFFLANPILTTTGVCSDNDGDEYQDGVDPDDDNDGTPDVDDCAPLDASLASAPEEAQDLAWSAGNKQTLGWTEGAASDSSNVYRGAIGGGFDCLADSVPGASYDDPEIPLAGEGFHYLVTGRNGCGESSAGTDSAGGPRAVNPCP